MSGDEAVRKEFEAWYGSQDARYRNGYLEDTIFAAGYAIGRSAAIQECADALRTHCNSVENGCEAAAAILALKER